LDEFGIYSRDDQGRPSPDPALFQRISAIKYGKGLAFASGFEGIFVPNGMTVEGKGTISAGTLSLAPDSALVLPPVKVSSGSASYSLDLSPDSSRSVTLRLQWGSDTAPAMDIPAAADGGEIRFKAAAGGQSLVVSGLGDRAITIAADSSGTGSLAVRVVNPASARTPIILLRAFAVRDK